MILKVMAVDIFTWVLLGVFLARSGVLNPSRIRFLQRKVVINFLLPSLILENILKNLTITDTVNMAILFGSALVMFAGTYAITMLWAPRVAKDSAMSNTMVFSNTFHNYGFMAFPLVISLLGEKGLALSLIFAMTFDGLLWSAGVYMLQRRPGTRLMLRDILTPPAVSVCLAATLALAGFPRHIPVQVFSFLHVPAMCTIPLALIGSGGIFYHSLHLMTKNEIPGRELALSMAFRMVLLPLLWIGAASWLLPDSAARSILYIQSVMPASIVIVIMVTIYGGNQPFVALFSLLSHLAAVLTIPFYLSFLF